MAGRFDKLFDNNWWIRSRVTVLARDLPGGWERYFEIPRRLLVRDRWLQLLRGGMESFYPDTVACRPAFLMAAELPLPQQIVAHGSLGAHRTQMLVAALLTHLPCILLKVIGPWTGRRCRSHSAMWCRPVSSSRNMD